MDSGWAVILGAVIALIGSSVVPWVRDALGDRRVQARAATGRRHDAVVSLLEANSSLGFAFAIQDNDRTLAAVKARSRAAVQLLLELPPRERAILSNVIDNTAPIPLAATDGIPPAIKIRVLQAVLLEWAREEISTDDLPVQYRQAIRSEQKLLKTTSESSSKDR